MTIIGQLVIAILLSIVGGMLLSVGGWLPGSVVLACAIFAAINFIKLVKGVDREE